MSVLEILLMCVNTCVFFFHSFSLYSKSTILIYTDIYTYIFANTLKYIYTKGGVHMWVIYTLVRMYIHIYIDIQKTYIHIYTYANTYTQQWAYGYIHKQLYIDIHMYIYIYTFRYIHY